MQWLEYEYARTDTVLYRILWAVCAFAGAVVAWHGDVFWVFWEWIAANFARLGLGFVLIKSDGEGLMRTSF